MEEDKKELEIRGAELLKKIKTLPPIFKLPKDKLKDFKEKYNLTNNQMMELTNILIINLLIIVGVLAGFLHGVIYQNKK